MEVIDVLQAVRSETESTHWCKGHYEFVEHWLGPPEDFVEGMPEKWMKTVDADLVERIYKVKHCLMGMVNTTIGVRAGMQSTATAWDLPEEKRELWKDTVNRLGLTIYGPLWSNDRRQVPVASSEAIRRMVGQEVHVPTDIESWNDRNNTTRESIIRLLDDAIDAEEASF